MKIWPLFVGVVVSLGLLFMACSASAQTCPEGATCVPPEDMEVFVSLLKAQKCRMDTPPKFTADPVVIVLDREGRVFGPGNNPNPYRLHMNWCNYEIDAASQLSIILAKRSEPTWGFRFRPKAAIGYLPVEALEEKEAGRGLEGGVLLEPLFYQWANVNVGVGVRSFGGGLGFDVLKNVTLYTGYAMAWASWRSNLHLAVGFALW